MAFGMTAARTGRTDAIDPDEEGLFLIPSELPGEFPLLVRIWSEFYDSPSLTAEDVRAVVRELERGPRALRPGRLPRLGSRDAERRRSAHPGAPRARDQARAHLRRASLPRHDRAPPRLLPARGRGGLARLLRQRLKS